MARRPVFISNDGEDARLVEEVLLEFEWSPGFAVSQKQKSVRALHQAAFDAGISPVLEVSTKSPDLLGERLSAFNLTIDMGDRAVPLEAAFQGSKVFERGGPFRDLYEMEGPAIKRDDRLRESGQLTAFDWQGDRWPLEPKTAFYDWLYINALWSHDVGAELVSYAGFTDIEFNPSKSINCQARSCALYVSLANRELLDDVRTRTPGEFRKLLTVGGSQDSLF